MRIGDAARALGVSRDTIRRLEVRADLAPRRDWAGHRRFTEDDLKTIRGLLYQIGEKQLPDVLPDRRCRTITNNQPSF